MPSRPKPGTATPRSGRGKAGVAASPARDRRRIPSVDALLRDPAAKKASAEFGRAVLKRALVEALADIRAAGGLPDGVDTEKILVHAIAAAARDVMGMDEVLNASGVLLHTGSGRAPLADEAVRAANRVTGYADLEIDRETGQRGLPRTSRAERILCALTGAEDALGVNNNAAALLLTLAALANRKEVLVSRGELIVIGGLFLIPDIMAASGAKLVEVGTTNRTRLADFRRALGPKTALILKVHTSNYKVVGFTEAVQPGELSKLAASAGIPFVNDVGSGLLDRFPGVDPDEPTVVESLRQGSDLVCFSGDKLLGGPQAGLVVGRGTLIERLRRHPINRTARMDKMSVAALEATLRLYATGRRGNIPIWRMLAASQRSIRERARQLSAAFPGSTVRTSVAHTGGGSFPLYPIPSYAVCLPVADQREMAARLRTGRPPVFPGIAKGELRFDLRTVPPEDDERLARAIRYALEQG
jgi:L-seryl-tRNA(Ser) seleniumtransferase